MQWPLWARLNYAIAWAVVVAVFAYPLASLLPLQGSVTLLRVAVASVVAAGCALAWRRTGRARVATQTIRVPLVLIGIANLAVLSGKLTTSVGFVIPEHLSLWNALVLLLYFALVPIERALTRGPSIGVQSPVSSPQQQGPTRVGPGAIAPPISILLLSWAAPDFVTSPFWVAAGIACLVSLWRLARGAMRGDLASSNERAGVLRRALTLACTAIAVGAIVWSARTADAFGRKVAGEVQSACDRDRVCPVELAGWRQRGNNGSWTTRAGSTAKYDVMYHPNSEHTAFNVVVIHSIDEARTFSGGVSAPVVEHHYNEGESQGSDAPGDLRVWVEVEPFASGSPEMGCANRSTAGEWSVALDQGHPVVRPYDRLARGDTTTLKTAYGLLVGIDKGEWGGGLSGHSGDGTAPYKLSDENIHSLLAIEGGVLAIAGLAHLGLDQGSILILRAQDQRWRVERSLKLDGAPMAVTRDPKSGIFIVTTRGLSRYSGGAVEKLHASGHLLLYPNSAAVTREGTVYVGMRHAVARLKPRKGGYSESWLVPPACASLVAADDLSACKCTSRPTGAH